MRYAKMQDGDAMFAPNALVISDFIVFNPTDEMFLNAGYLPVVETAPPEVDENHIAVPLYAEDGNTIVQSWAVEEKPQSIEDKAEAFDILMGVSE